MKLPMTTPQAGGRYRSTSVACGIALSLIAFVGLGVVAHRANAGTAVDHSLLHWMVEHRRGWLTSVAIAITNAGSPVAMALLAALAAALLWRRHSPLSAVFVVTTLASATGLSTITKAVVSAQRPPQSMQLVLEVDPSFPSGHVTGVLTFAGILAVVVGRRCSTAARVALMIGVVAVTVAVALTRLYLGVHWLTDIGGAIMLATAVILTAVTILGLATRRSRESGRQDVESAARNVEPVA